ncbi:hypothetical protein KUTeg_015889 [Tegillarca granosa]|uniref:Uncharacterized protein n=1 Tax=Tegillarca granosa TaxID=220873 RepID=A0ABQ9EJ83_TEGGR|nr:hypothetical protein KUTeg_015889 [Tegillarca granosa]
MASNIRVTVEFNENAQKHFIKCQKKNNNLYFKVSIPSPLIGVNEELRVNDKWHGKLIKRSNKEDQPFLFSIFSPITNKKDVTENNVIILECQVSPQRRCKVRLTKFKNRNVNLFQLNTCEVVIPKLVSSNAEMRIIAKGDIRIMAIVESPIITLKSKEGNVTVTSEGTLRTSSLNMKCSTANVNGIICGLSGSFFRSHYTHANTTKPCEDNIINSIHLAIVGNLNVGTDGKIGCGRKNVSNSLVAFLEITVTENICNFGIITAFSQISLEARNMLSGKNCKVDTVQRNYNNIIELHGLQKDVKDTEIEPTISNLILAVKNQKVEQVASLLQSGVDPSLPALKHGKTVQDLASEELCKKTEKDPQYGYERNRANLVYSLIKAWDKRSGSIISRIIKCSLKGDIEDCSQLLGLVEVYFDVNGDITVEEDSIWTSGNVTGRCKGNFTFDGRTNLQEFHNMVIENTCHIKNTGTVLLAEGGTLSVKKWLKNNGVLYVYSQDIKSQLHVTTDVFEQTRNAKMVSNSLLQLTILADTAEWEGDMKGKSVCFDVRAKVQTFCNIESAHLCLIKIMEGKNGTGQFILGQKGLITVTDGKFVAVRENCESRKLADILVNGKLSSKGIHAIDVKVELLDNSFVEVLQNSHCFIKDLRTKQKSTIHFTVSEKCKPVVCKIDYWSHFGKMKVKKMSPVSCVLNVEAFTILQNGKIENCDQMNLNIKE